MDDLRVEKVLRAVECIPRGKLATYGDIGAITGESPRVVGNLLARWGSNVAWWRVCNAKGEIPGHFNEALPHWREENISLNPAGTGAQLKSHRIELEELEVHWKKATADLT
ncbi:MGMT family protein [Rothia aerolata]|uniref:Methylated-DNA--protein-cysteine methyltransferase n=1 Tax=Rothia aerolata TaxID=1812262 RepID=A0A917MTR8_9MICC|nr:MGMT family protein [Rothia aerolata]GGH63304.1 methylated-DNA--protein-cysteine methyltransferase [Rothia aerolata]